MAHHDAAGSAARRPAHQDAGLRGGQAAAVKIIFEGPLDPRKYPAQALAHDGRDSIWFLDAEAAKLIEG